MPLRTEEPLVTVGIPTYNRPEQLSRALSLICGQTYRNLQIIVSDNASPSEDVSKVVDSFIKNDPRITYFRQEVNRGPRENFAFVLTRAVGEFFMWAADDDRWEPFFIEKCVRELVADPEIALCHMEGRYELISGDLFTDFAEGAAFYNFSSKSAVGRVEHLLRNVFDKLIYGVFRRDVLFKDGRPLNEWIGRTLNEIPLFLLVAAKGNIRMLPEVGMYKVAAATVCEQAKWEQVGGHYPTRSRWLAHIRSLLPLFQYHWLVMNEVVAAVDAAELEFEEKKSIKRLVRWLLLRHALYFVFRWKPQRPVVSKSC